MLVFFETDDKHLDRSWYHHVAINWSLLRVFFISLKGTGDAHMASVISQDILRWRDKAFPLLQKRAPWMAQRSDGRTAPGPADILVVPL